MKIAFLDYDLNHSHATFFLKLIRELPSDQKVEVVCAWEMKPTDADWCTAQGVKKAGTLEEAVAEADAVMILAPDNIDEHLQLFQKTAAALKQPKPVYIDKYLHTKLNEAREIVALAKRKRIPIASGSALRFAPDLEKALPEMQNVRTCTVTGYGPLWQYAIHTVSLGMRILGPGLTRVIDTGTNEEACITAEFGARKMFAHVVMSENSVHVFPWSFSAFCASDKASCGFICVAGKVSGGFFENLIRATCEFLRTGKSPMTTAEMIDTVAVLDLAEQSRKAGGVWLSVK